MTITWDDLKERGEPGQCRSCGYPVQWLLTAAGKRAPYNAGQFDVEADPVSHFATCPQATAWRRKPTTK